MTSLAGSPSQMKRNGQMKRTNETDYARNKQVDMATPRFAVTTGKISLAWNTKLELKIKGPTKGPRKWRKLLYFLLIYFLSR